MVYSIYSSDTMTDVSGGPDTRSPRLEVLMSGTTLSFLTFKLKNCQGDTEGFLYGHISNRVIQEVSDTQEEYESILRRITITDFICFKNKFTFYDRCGRLDGAKCARVECLSAGTQAHARAVGWFSFRRNTTSGMSVREKFIHGQLTGLFTPESDTFLHLLLIETLSNQLVLEQLGISVSTYAPAPSGGHLASSHSLRIVNLDATASAKSYKYPVEISGLAVTHAISMDTILTPFSEQIGPKPPFLQSSQMIAQISNTVLERMSDMKTQILSNARRIDQLKSDISQMSRDPVYSLDLTPSAPPSSLLSNITKRSSDRKLPQKAVTDYNTYQGPAQDKIINQDPNLPLYAHATAGLFPPLEPNATHSASDQPPPYSPSPQGHSGPPEIPYSPHVPMDTVSTHVARPTFIHDNNNNNNNNNNRIPISFYDKYADTPSRISFLHPGANRGVKSARLGFTDESSA